MAPSEIARRLTPRPLTLRVDRYRCGAVIQGSNGGDGQMEAEESHGELINLLQVRYKQATARVAELEALLEASKQDHKMAEPHEALLSRLTASDQTKEGDLALQAEVASLRRRNEMLEAKLEAQEARAKEEKQKHDDRIYILTSELDRLREENETHIMLARNAPE